MPFSTYTNLGLGELAPTKLIVELADRTVKRPKAIAKNVLVWIDKFVFPVDFIVQDMPKDIKTPLILRRPFLSTAHAKVDFKRRMELELEAMLMGEALIVNRSLDLLYEDYIKLNDLNEPLELRRNRVDDLEPTYKEGEVVDEPMMDIVKTRCDDEIIDGLDEYPSYYDFNKKIHIDYARLNGTDIQEQDQKESQNQTKPSTEWKGQSQRTAYSAYLAELYINRDFTIMENMDFYHGEGMGDIIVGRPFCRESCIKARRFNGMITIYNGKDSVTYQIEQSHLRFKHLTNAQCNKMRPLLKVSAHGELKGISHPYQKLKGFYKGVLNLGPEYIKNKNVEEWHTCGHVSVHEIE
ncbi:gag-pol polyprotein [Tanacetum coccineum]